MSEEGPASDEIWITRFSGREVYRIASARWNLVEEPDHGWWNLWIEVRCEQAIQQAEDTAELGAHLDWELNLVEKHIDEAELAPGFRAAIPAGFDESRDGWITNFYYCEHQGTDDNTIAVLAREGDRLRLRITGRVVDLNYYDGSKPKAELLVEAWFDKDASGARSMS